MSKGDKNRCLRFNDNRSSRMHRGHNGHPGPSSDHLSERGLDNVWRISRTEGNTLKGAFEVKGLF